MQLVQGYILSEACLRQEFGQIFHILLFQEFTGKPCLMVSGKIFMQLIVILRENLLFIYFSRNFSRKSMEKCDKIYDITTQNPVRMTSEILRDFFF